MLYDWQRFWLPAGGTLTLDASGYFPDPSSKYGAALNRESVTLEAGAETHCLVLLGEAGMGKTSVVDAECERLSSSATVTRVDLGGCTSEESIIREIFESPAYKSDAGQAYLFLDALDECVVPAVDRVLAREFKRRHTDSVRVRIVCRTGAWQATLNDRLREVWGASGLRALELAPLRQEDIELAAAANQLDAAAFIGQIADRNAQPLAMKPVTLRLLLNQFSKAASLSRTQVELYADGCMALCEETNVERLGSRLVGQLSARERLAIVERIGAMMMLCGRAKVTNAPSAVEPGALALNDIAVGTESMPQGGSTAVSESAVREVLQHTGFFVASGSFLTFAHRTFAEFLAARYLVRHRFTLVQLTTILLHADGDGRVVPQLMGVAGWAALLDTNLLRLLIDNDPQVLLDLDLSGATDDLRAALVSGVLARCEAGELLEQGWDRHRRYRHLGHSGLSEQLRPFLLEKARAPMARALAVAIAQVCNVTPLDDALVERVLDPDELLPIRVRAARVLEKGERRSVTERLASLALGTPSDKDDDLKGIALRALWPDVPGSATPFEYITPRRRDNYSGAYAGFLYSQMPERITDDLLAEALRWLGSISAWSSDHTFRVAADAILKKALSCDTVSNRTGIVTYFWQRFEAHEPLWHERDRGFSSETQRRAIVVTMLTQKPTISSREAFSLVHGSPALLRSDDIPWLIEQLDGQTAPVAREALAQCLAKTFVFGQAAETIDLVVDAWQRHEVLRPHFDPWFSAVPWPSEEAQAMKERHHEHLEMLAQRQGRAEPAPQEELERILADDIDDLDRWFWIARLLEEQHYHSAGIETAPLWQTLAEGQKERVIALAKNYVLGGGPGDTTPLEVDNSFSYLAIFGYQALRLIEVVDRGWIATVEPEIWRKWTPIALTYSWDPESSGHKNIVEFAHRANAGDLAAFVGAVIRSRATRGSGAINLQQFADCQSTELDRTLLSLGRDTSLPPIGTSEVLTCLFERNHPDALSTAVSLISGPPPAESDATGRERIVHVSVLLLARNGDAAWPRVARILHDDVALGKAIVSRLAQHSWFRDNAAPLQGFRPAQRAELYVWAARNFDEAPPRPMRMHQPTTEQDVADLCGNILTSLQTAGTPDALVAIEEIQRTLPERDWIRWTRLQAINAVLERSWRAIDPASLVALAHDRDARFVASGSDLLAVVLESLDRLERGLQGTPPQAQYLWNTHPTYRPKEEEAFSDLVQTHLRDDLERHQVVVNREVQIRRKLGGAPGEQPDLIVEAVARGDAAVVAVVIEAKGCWHPALMTAMESQLANRYLADGQYQHGVYLVGSFQCTQWDSTDDRRTRSAARSRESLKTELTKQAEDLSDKGRTIRARVLNTSLR